MKNSLAQLYTKQSRPREACAIFQDINIARDSINARNYSTQINLLRTIYQVDRLEMDNQSERSRLLFLFNYRLYPHSRHIYCIRTLYS